MFERPTLPVRARTRETALPPPLPKPHARRDPGTRAALLRTLALHQRHVDMLKAEHASSRSALAAAADLIGEVLGALDRLELELETAGRPPQRSRRHRRLSAELAERRRLEADLKEDVAALAQQLEYFRLRVSATRQKLSAVAA
jgi:hypothetical protein